jgi:hypothetical protein
VKPRARVLRHARVLFAALATSCADPYYVSLGGNAAELERDASVAPTCASDEVMLIPGSCGVPVPEVDRCETSSAIVPLDGDCSARTLVTCPPPAVPTSGSLERDALDALLTALLRSCQPEPNALRVRFTGGCATSYAIDFDLGQGDAGRGVGDCVAARLGSERYDCAGSIECGVGEIFGVPTSSVEPDWL